MYRWKWPMRVSGGMGWSSRSSSVRWLKSASRSSGSRPSLRRAVSAAGLEVAVDHAHGAVFRRLGVELDVVALRVVEVGGLGHDVIGGRVGPAQREQAGDGPRQLAPVGQQDGEVVQAGGAAVAPGLAVLGQPQQVGAARRPGRRRHRRRQCSFSPMAF